MKGLRISVYACINVLTTLFFGWDQYYNILLDIVNYKAIISSVVGAIIGVGAAFILEYFDESISFLMKCFMSATLAIVLKIILPFVLMPFF